MRTQAYHWHPANCRGQVRSRKEEASQKQVRATRSTKILLLIHFPPLPPPPPLNTLPTEPMILHRVSMSSEAGQPSNDDRSHPFELPLPFLLPVPVFPSPLNWPFVPPPTLLLPFASPLPANSVLGTAAVAPPPACAGTVLVLGPGPFPSLLSVRL